MPPNWNKFKQEFDYMIDNFGEQINCITIGSGSYYDDEIGTVFATSNTLVTTVSIQQTTKVELENLPEGFRTKKVKKMFSRRKFDNNDTIERSDGDSFKIVKPSDDYTAGNILMGYKTFIAKEENE